MRGDTPRGPTPAQHRPWAPLGERPSLGAEVVEEAEPTQLRRRQLVGSAQLAARPAHEMIVKVPRPPDAARGHSSRRVGVARPRPHGLQLPDAF